MEVLYPRCAGLDVHQQTVVACARLASGSTVQQDVRTFGTATGNTVTNLYSTAINTYPLAFAGGTAGGRTFRFAVGFRF